MRHIKCREESILYLRQNLGKTVGPVPKEFYAERLKSPRQRDRSRPRVPSGGAAELHKTPLASAFP